MIKMLSPTSKQTTDLEHDLQTKGKSPLTDSAHETPIKQDLKTSNAPCSGSSKSVHVTESPLQTSTRSQKWDYRRAHKYYNKNRRSSAETNRDSNDTLRKNARISSNPNSPSTHLDRSANHTPNNHSNKSNRYYGKKNDRRSYKPSHSSSEIN